MRFGRLCIFSTPIIEPKSSLTLKLKETPCFGHWSSHSHGMPWIGSTFHAPKDTTDAWFGKASDRYDKLRERSFLEIEAAELLHSLSFQRELESTGADSKRRPEVPEVGKWVEGYRRWIFPIKKTQSLFLKKTPCVSWGKGGVTIQKWVSRH